MSSPDTRRPGRRVLVIGGSIGGLFAGTLLYRTGWDVHVYEQKLNNLAGHGAGILAHPMLFAAMARAGLTVETRLGVDVTERVVFSPNGAPSARMPFPQTVISWRFLHALLLRALPAGRYHHGANLTGVDVKRDKVTASFDDGSHETGDLLIGADGIGSTVRRQFLPHTLPEYAGYVAWHGLSPEAALKPKHAANLFDRVSFFLPPGEQILGYPVAEPGESTENGDNGFCFVWYRPASTGTALADMLTEEGGNQRDGGIPSHLTPASVSQEMRVAADEILPPAFRDAVAGSKHPFLQPIFDLMSPEILFGRVILIGDAAFVARPHAGMGVTKAAEDALSLTNALAEVGSIDSALARFQEDRLSKGRAIVERGRALGAGISSTPEAPADPSRYDRARAPETMMLETAASMAA